MKHSNLHDWEINAILTDYDAQLVCIRLHYPENNDVLTLDIKGIRHFYVSEMRLQNVILDVLIFDKNMDSDYFSFCKEALNIKDNFFDENHDLKILYIEPSVGLELVCSFREIKIVKGSHLG